MAKAVEFVKINKRFPGVHVLKDISFSVEEGEVHALLGENGAGKSTLLNILHGVYPEYEGEVRLHGKKVSFKDTNDAIVNGKISKVHQETLVVKDLTVGQNVTMGYEPKKGIFIDFKKMNKDVDVILEDLNCNFKSSDLVSTLTAGEMQMLAIARALYHHSTIISLDEPTASITMKETEALFDVVRKLKKQGVTILYVSHRLEEIFQICDRASILRDGEYIQTMDIKNTTREELIHAMVGRDVAAVASRTKPSPRTDEVVLSVEHLTNENYQDVSFELHKGEILGFETIGEGRQRRLTAHFSDGTGVVDLVWFQGIKYILGKYKLHEEYIIFGKPTVFNGRINVAHPDVDKPDDLKLSSVGLQPYYSTTEKMKRSFLNSHAIEKMMATVIQQIQEPLPETLSPKLLTEHHLMPLTEALWNIHFPTNPDVLRRAQYRLKFEELFYVQLNILRYAKDRQKRYRGYIFEKVGDVFNTFYTKNLPFQLTGAQKRVLKEIRNDVGSGRQMNRLLQGDVGSGKTLVALMSMLLALDNGYQACMMAPTEILANQHYETIKELLFGMDIRVELLTGSIKGKRREAILTGLLTGDVKILIGTHAVIEDTVNFSSLGFVVIDEQHRFGVAQRARLWSKNVQPPHVLVMTATPIPRTLAMTLYGDLDVSIIDELPPGRKPITTIHQFDNRRESMYRSVRKQIDEGRQVYIVYPLIKESEKIDLKNLEEGYQHILEEFPKCTVCKVHGKMKPAEKDEQMQLFVSGKAQIMVATTVIEVGVNVPNASVMIIENAERFGLSQLHQLRGRVGRGAEQSYCILVTNYKLTEDTRKRLEIMVRTNDGFEIAEADLKLRGPGDLEGTQQSGIAFDLKIADIVRDGQLLQYVRAIAESIVEQDPAAQSPENEILWRQLKALRKTNVNWAAIS